MLYYLELEHDNITPLLIKMTELCPVTCGEIELLLNPAICEMQTHMCP